MTAWSEVYDEYDKAYERKETKASLNGWLIEQLVTARRERDQARALLGGEVLTLCQAVIKRVVSVLDVRRAEALIRRIEREG